LACRNELRGPVHSPFSDEGLIALNVHDRIELQEALLRGDLSHPFRSRSVIGAGHYTVSACRSNRARDRFIVRCDYDAVGDMHF
jgi:hypothetical protein